MKFRLVFVYSCLGGRDCLDRPGLASAGLGERLGMVRAPGTESGNGNVWQWWQYSPACKAAKARQTVARVRSAASDWAHSSPRLSLAVGSCLITSRSRSRASEHEPAQNNLEQFLLQKTLGSSFSFKACCWFPCPVAWVFRKAFVSEWWQYLELWPWTSSDSWNSLETFSSSILGESVSRTRHEWLLGLRALWKSLMLIESFETELLSHASWNHLETALDIVTQEESETLAPALSELKLVRVLRGSISKHYPETFLTPYLDEAHIRLNLESRGKSDSSCQRKPSDAFCINDSLTFALTRFWKKSEEIDLICRLLTADQL